jgi:aminopeptidase N
MVLPLRVGLVGKTGTDLPLKPRDNAAVFDDVILLTRPKQTVTFADVAERPVVSINRGFSAPVALVGDLTEDDLAFLAAHDSDPFNRWQVVQSIATSLLTSNVAATRNGKPLRNDPRLIEAMASALDDKRLEPAFVALMLTPPGEADIAREIGKDIDPGAIHRARLSLRADIGRSLGKTLADTYERMAVRGPYSPSATDAGKRALRNACLDLMATAGNANAVARADRQYDQADNMTDRLAALATLTQHGGPARERALADFYARYRDHALVIDKWFALQATIPDDGALDRVRDLTKHPAFSYSNPNRMRSLIATFAMSNPSQFHREDGQGYDFIADTVLALDPRNPQVAARLATAFRTWRSMDAARRQKAEAALSRIKSASGLSRDVSDIVERALEPI